MTLLRLLVSSLSEDFFLAFTLVGACVAGMWRISEPRSGSLAETLARSIPVGLVASIVASTWLVVSEVLPNRYLSLGLFQVVAHDLFDRTSSILFASIGVGLGFWILRAAPLNRPGASRRHAQYLLAAPGAALTIVVGTFWLNRWLLAGYFAPKFLLGTSVWLAASCFLWTWLVRVLDRASTGAPSPSRRWCFVTAAILLASHLGWCRLRTIENDNRPNLILISIDTLRQDHVGAYGYERETTPNIDQLAATGLLFRNAIAQAPWTLPSHMSMLTGLYPSGHGVFSPQHRLTKDKLTIAELLRNSGYRTVAFTGGGFVREQFGYQGFELFVQRPGHAERRQAEAVLASASEWMRRSPDQPFFMLFHTYQVHAPYDPPPEHDLFASDQYAGLIEVADRTYRDFNAQKEHMTAADYSYLIDKYDGNIHYTDAVIGNLFEELKRSELWERTVVILTSDHGENFDDHLQYELGHDELYSEVLRIPLVLSGPGIPAGRVTERVVESTDLMPTLLQLAGVTCPVQLDGSSLLDQLESPGEGEIAFSEHASTDRIGEVAATSRGWKALVRDNGDFEVYDISRDPSEQSNVLDHDDLRGQSLLATLISWARHQEKRRQSISTETQQLQESVRDELRALGYL